MFASNIHNHNLFEINIEYFNFVLLVDIDMQFLQAA